MKIHEIIPESTAKLIGSAKTFREPGVLKAKAKVQKQTILGATPKKNKTLSKKFFGCSKVPNTTNPMLAEQPIETAPRAGFIPYVLVDGTFYMRFYISSNAQYGGPDWQIPKGRVDEGENVQQAGIREAVEECGLVPENLKKDTIQIGWSGTITGMDARYPLTIFIGEVIDPKNFVKPGFEASKSGWLTLEQFLSKGRRSQQNIVKACASKIK